METSDWITLAAVVMAFLSLVIAVKSYLAAERMANANEELARANQEMAKAADLAAQSARSLADIEAARDCAVKSAKLVIHRDNHPDGLFQEQPGTFSLVPRIGVCLQNKGDVEARNVGVEIILDDGTIIRPDGQSVFESGTANVREPGNWTCLVLGVAKTLYGDRDDTIVVFRVSYRDETGPSERTFRVRLKGMWPGFWLASLLTEG